VHQAVSDINEPTEEPELKSSELHQQSKVLLQSRQSNSSTEDKYHELFENAPAGYFVLSPDDTILELNLAGVQMLGNESSALLNSLFTSYVCDNSRQDYTQFLTRLFNSGHEESCEIELSVNKHKCLHLVGQAAQNRDYARIIAINSTGCRRLEAGQIDALDRLNKISDQLPGVVYQYRLCPDGSSCYPYSSQAMKDIFGLRPDEVLHDATRAFSIIHPDDFEGFVASKKVSARDLTPWHHEYRVKYENGTIRSLYGNAMPQQETDGSILWHGYITDITEIKKAQEEIELKNIQLQKANAEKDKFFSIIAHDLRSPFNAFLGFTEMMVDEILTMEPSEIKKTAISMRNSAVNFYSLLSNLLEWSRMQRGLTRFEPTRFLLLPHIEAGIDLITEFAERKKIKIIFNIPEETEVFADKYMLECIFRNLLNNAVKFTPRSGKITVSATTVSGSSVEISVKDTGIGMDPQLIENLYRLDVNTSRHGTEGEMSTGLGLNICKDFIEKHGGKLMIESEEGKGSTLKFSVPGKPQVAVKPSAASSGDPLVEFPKLKILIAEDDETSQILITMAVKQFSREVLKVMNGVEAVEACRNNPDIDLIMMDISMPQMDGYEATRNIRQFNKSVIIIAQTAFVQTEYREKALDAGCNDYINKPIKISMLKGLIQKYFIN